MASNVPADLLPELHNNGKSLVCHSSIRKVLHLPNQLGVARGSSSHDEASNLGSCLVCSFEFFLDVIDLQSSVGVALALDAYAAIVGIDENVYAGLLLPAPAIDGGEFVSKYHPVDSSAHFLECAVVGGFRNFSLDQMHFSVPRRRRRVLLGVDVL